MKKIRWVKPVDGLRPEGMIEANDDDLCAAWVQAGHAEYVEDEAPTHAEKQAADLEARRKPVESPADQVGEDKAVHQAPVDRALKAKGRGR